MIRLIPLPLAIILSTFATSLGDEISLEMQLVEAARQGKMERVKELLDEGVDINARPRFEITALWQAAGKDHYDLLKFLVESGADVNVPDTVWHAAPLNLVTDPRVVALLIKHGAKGAEQKLYTAAIQGNLELVRAIINARKMDPKSLALAEAQAEIAGRLEIVKLIRQTAKTLPNLPAIPESQLAVYRGRYVSDRLNEIEIILRKGRLYLKHLGGGRESQLIAVDQQSFAVGPLHYRFAIQNGKVTELFEENVFSRRRYVPKSEVPAEIPKAGEISSEAAETEAAHVLARNRWPSFRGIEARGIAVDQDLPKEWNAAENKNVRWRTPIAGLSNSCPIVWEDKVFLTTATSEEGKEDLRIGLYGDIGAVDDKSKHTWRILCLDKRSGNILWDRIACEGIPPVKRHFKSSQANSTPATNGKHVVALFNSGGLYCYDFTGQLLWSKQLGLLDSGALHDRDYQWGFGSSPIIYRDTVIVQCDLQERSFIATYDINTGDEIWKESRDEPPSWGTPTVYESPRGPLLLTNGTNFARAYDVVSGREVWRLSGNAAITVPTPFVAADLAFITSGYRPIQPIFAVRIGAKGDISLKGGEDSTSSIAWNKQRGGPYLPTPIAYRGYFYTCSNNGILTCYEALTGKQVYRKRAARSIANSFTASLVAADGLIYLTAESGDVMTVKAGPKFELIRQNSLGEYCLSTPAIAGGLFLARTHKHLVAIGK